MPHVAGQAVPFPVEVPFRVRADLRRWSPDDAGALRRDGRARAYLEAKLDVLRRDPDGCRVVAPGRTPERVLEDVAAAAARLSADLEAHGDGAHGDGARGDGARGGVPLVWGPNGLELPHLGLAVSRDGRRMRRVAVPDGVAGGTAGGLADDVASGVAREIAEGAGDGAGAGAGAGAGDGSVGDALRHATDRVAAWLEPLPPHLRLLDALALAVQEDLVWMGEGGPPGAPGNGSADVLHVCFPSGWDPAARAGATFEALHAPVPGNERLQGAAGAVMRAMLRKGPFVRYVWSLAPDAALDRNPRRSASAPPAAPGALVFRAERQTTVPLPPDADGRARALFTIRVYVAPLPEVLAAAGPEREPERRRRLAASLRSMEPAMADYKGVAGMRARTIAWLEEGAEGGPEGVAAEGVDADG